MVNSKYFSFLLLAFILFSCSEKEQLLIPEGITRWSNFESKYVDSRNIDIYFPKQYSNSNLHFPVLYVHDGQMVFDERLSWNKQTWNLDSVSYEMITQNEIEPFIIVAIWNTEKRWEEYMPQDVFDHLDQKDKQDKYHDVISNNYLKFIVEELKPAVDSKFRTKKDAKNTSILGASMGGLISWYALTKYPDTFGNAICMSSHWPGVKPEYKHPLPTAIKSYFEEHLPPPGKHKLYFDFGTETLDHYYEPHQNDIDTILMNKGYGLKSDYLTMKFKGADHSENSWRVRVNFPFKYIYNLAPATF